MSPVTESCDKNIVKNKISLIGIVVFCFIVNVEAQISANRDDTGFPYRNMPEVLPGSKPLTWDGDLSVKMLDGAHKFIEEKIHESISNRLKLWTRDLRSPAAYEKSVEPNRKRFMQYIGVEDKSKPLSNYNVGLEDKHPEVVMQKISVNNDSDLIAETAKYKVYQVRWPVLNRVYGEGLLLQPRTKPVAKKYKN